MSKPFILWNNISGIGTLTASTTETGFDALNLLDWRTYTQWRGTGTGDQYINIDCLGANPADTLVIFGHNIGSHGGSILLQASSDNFASDIVNVVASFSPGDDSIIVKQFSSATKRYWRIRISGYDSAPYITLVCLGVALQFPRHMTGEFDPIAQQIITSSARSQTGNLLGVAYSHRQLKISAEWDNVSASWVDTYFDDFWEDHAVYLKPFFFVWDYLGHPTQSFLVSLPDDFTRNFPYNGMNKKIKLDLIGSVDCI